MDIKPGTCKILCKLNSSYISDIIRWALSLSLFTDFSRLTCRSIDLRSIGSKTGLIRVSLLVLYFVGAIRLGRTGGIGRDIR